ncbi:MAG: HAD hydrolase family protein [Clostridia bacterium]|jgi:3-deoxy-D-manno-octulosonate 8-phosphate phosphatase (KDO 8-P phosphatase)|nr:HAD hydrolase family protein [Clostridia bacterium]
MGLNNNISDAVERAKKIKLVILDVHGVLTTNDVIYDEDGRKYRVFCQEDGFGCNALMYCGVQVAVITSKSKGLEEKRMSDIGVKHFHITTKKIPKYEELLQEFGISDEEACFVGDEIIDMGVMKRVGLAVAPSDGRAQVHEISHYVTEKAGGKGVIRELAEFILQAQGKWEGFCDKVINKGW